MNYDISFNGDNSYLYGLFHKFFAGKINLYSDEFNIQDIFDKLVSMSLSDAENLREEVKLRS